MPQIINTNIMSLNAQRNLNNSQSALQLSLQRLSSGLRINSAKDDAAGLAISERFSTQIRGLNQAVRNANDGISLAQTAEGALAEITNNLQRIRELAVQASNATNSASDRAALNQEVQQRLAEMDRVASQTSFNGQRILDGSFGNAIFQVGANVGETISVNLDASMRLNDVGAVATATTVDLSTLVRPEQTGYALAEGELTVSVDGGSTTVDVAAGIYTSAQQLATAINSAAGSAIASVQNGELRITNTDDTNAIEFGGAAATALGLPATVAPAEDKFVIGEGEFTITQDGTEFAVPAGTYDDVDALVAAVTALSIPGVTATNEAGELRLAVGAGQEPITVGGAFATAVGLAGSIAAGANKDSTDIADAVQSVPTTEDSTDVADALSGTIPAVTLTLNAGDLSIQLGDAEAVEITGSFTTEAELLNAINKALGGNAIASIDAETHVLSFTTGVDIVIGGARSSDIFTAGQVSAAGNLSTVNVLNVDASNDAIHRIDAALTSVSSLRSTFGAIQNRFESTISNLSTTAENMTAARSRILDADFAAETAELTRAQILQQAGVAMLSQANQMPQNVLSLLR